MVKADILVYPSRYDSFGMVVTEAMAAGVPVIVDFVLEPARSLNQADQDSWWILTT